MQKKTQNAKKDKTKEHEKLEGRTLKQNKQQWETNMLVFKQCQKTKI